MKKEKIIIANWKMQLTLKESKDLAREISKKFKGFKGGEVVVCPNHIVLDEVAKITKSSGVKVGAQNVFWEEAGAFTGETSPGLLAEAGCEYVILGHSERRKYLLENYAMINKELKAVLNTSSLVPIVCIGENWDERKTDRRDFVLDDQLRMALSGIEIIGDQQIIIAYEPIWAIGTGSSMEPAEAEYSHKIIKLTLNKMYGLNIVEKNFRVVYGGSINSQNASGFAKIDYLDGLLVGGASLKANEFLKVAKIITK